MQSIPTNDAFGARNRRIVWNHPGDTCNAMSRSLHDRSFLRHSHWSSQMGREVRTSSVFARSVSEATPRARNIYSCMVHVFTCSGSGQQYQLASDVPIIGEKSTFYSSLSILSCCL
ncbi:hypothetical protein AcW1_009238 [Taiwanofungus camphoratus]|nr:hypothetical protein AcV5_007262 [Antrodia cinnamomea]KAI0949711.1 hypothetical protein AcW1_009238 [Antrodia cinnamomea]